MARTTASAVTNQFASQVGYREGRNNYTKYASIANHANNRAWCATFITAMFKLAGQEMVSGTTSPSCYYNVQAYKKAGRFSWWPAVGAVFFLGPGGTTHTGYVYKYTANYVYTIEGNTNNNGSNRGDGVYRRRRTRASIYGYGYPRYSHAIHSADPKWGDNNSGGSDHNTTPGFPGANKFGPGENNSYVTQLGKWLIERGADRFYEEGPGPRWSDADRDATRAFQKAQGWSGADANGIPGPTTWDYLKNDKGKDIPKPKSKDKPEPKQQTTRRDGKVVLDHIKWHKEDWCIEEFQLALIRKGFDIAAGATGYYGNQTKSACKRFQRSQGWRGNGANGFPGPLTIEKLGLEEYGENSKAKPDPDDEYPGWGMFGPGANNEYVTRLGKMLIKRGGKRFYEVGPGPKWSDSDHDAVLAFERAQGWDGDDVDGRPGAYGWKLLVTGKGKDIPKKKKKKKKKRRDAGSWMYFDNVGPGDTTHANLVIQKALKWEFRKFDYSSGPGVFGPRTKKYYAKWQRRLGYRGAAADGIPGRTSLEKLADKYHFDVRYRKKKRASGGRASSPVPGHRVTYPYGVRNSGYAAGYHTGDDYAAAHGTSVVAVRDGTIQWSNGSGGAYGNWIGLRADNGRVYVYCHLSTRSVSTGTRVSAGQRIGRVGSTGNSTGPHLHFEDHPSGGFVYGRGRNPRW